MDLNQVFPSKYLRGLDLAGRAVTVTIESVILEDFYDQEKKAYTKKPVIYCQGKQKGIVLSKSMAYQVAEALGSFETDNWKGRQVVLFSTKRRIFGQDKDIIQARVAED